MIKRFITSRILNNLHKGKAILIMGARQSGKTTLLKGLFPAQQDVLYLNCDDLEDRNLLAAETISSMKQFAGKSKYILIDEAQRVQNIGLKLKLLVDNFPEVQIIATGSSSFELSNQIMEPLTGRKYEFYLYPFAYQELADNFGAYRERKELANRLIYGSYPDIVNHPSEAATLLNHLVGSYLYKDIFTFQDLRKPELLDRLLNALALQIGSEVSYNELAQLISTDQKTIQKYIQLLEQAYIIFRLPNYSTNQRNEIKRSRKIYFWDNGVRNCLITDFRDIAVRDDIGKLWENYIVSERMKLLSNAGILRKSYFWRNIHKSEIDYLEVYEDKITAYEIKWNPQRNFKATAFTSLYPQAGLFLINPENYSEFLYVLPQ